MRYWAVIFTVDRWKTANVFKVMANECVKLNSRTIKADKAEIKFDRQFLAPQEISEEQYMAHSIDIDVVKNGENWRLN